MNKRKETDLITQSPYFFSNDVFHLFRVFPSFPPSSVWPCFFLSRRCCPDGLRIFLSKSDNYTNTIINNYQSYHLADNNSLNPSCLRPSAPGNRDSFTAAHCSHLAMEESVLSCYHTTVERKRAWCPPRTMDIREARCSSWGVTWCPCEGL